ncbi:hypothetical protein ACJZ2D_003324 [Fusarium nematophilum]
MGLFQTIEGLKMPQTISSSFWALAACIILAHLTTSRILSWYRLRHISGPRFAAWTDLWLIIKTWQGNMFADLGEVCEQHGIDDTFLPQRYEPSH